ncbi:DUF4328 domain-containing protein [Actinokineospora sp. HUAS TT18]|uniref:DUF4328 domain-containing protein n=1 Tax=Actinokineospora sp. HUAS TT18 TaxID=3447451 RepID=UPI003F52087E
MTRPVRRLGAVSAALIAATAAFALTLAWPMWDSYFLTERFVQGDPTVSAHDVQAADARVTRFALIYLGVAALSAVVFITWLARARRNAEILCPADHRRTRGWVMGAWFCPFMNVWFPFQVVQDIWKTSDPTTPRRLAERAADGLDGLKFIPGGGLVAWWWGCTVGAVAINFFASTTLLDTYNPDIDTFHSVAVANTVARVLTAAAAVLLILAMRRIVRWQEQTR